MARRSKVSLFFFLFLLVLLGGAAYLLFQDMTSPVITIEPHQEIVSPTLPITVTIADEKSAIKNLRILVRHNEKEIPVLEQTFAEPSQKQQVTFTLEKTGLKDSSFDLEITAADASFFMLGRGNHSTEIYPMRIDLTPPRLSVKSSIPYVRRGGTGVVVYSITKEVRQTGVKVGELFFPGFRQANGDYLCFFAFPYFIDMKEYSPKLVAVDIAGNAQVNDLSVNRMPRQFKQDTIAITQGFLDAKAKEFSGIVPGDMTDIERFLQVNGAVRRANAQTLMEIGRDTSPEILWKEAFLRLPRAASRAGFADFRTYTWQGKKVDEQTHLGFDLASLKHSEVPAANSGKVVFAGYLGIYGNLIVIDHGLGLQSLYSHLSEIDVQKGQAIEKGQIIGHTGATGMAGGDHLHFGILISGLEVTPLEWLDDHWIKDNVVDRIIEAGGVAPAFKVSPIAAPTEQKAPAKPAARKKTPKKPAKKNTSQVR